MKHLHLFENKGDVFWIVVFENTEDGSSNYVSLFDDMESAKNYYIEIANELKANLKYRKHAGRYHTDLSEDEIIVTVDEAEDWLSNNYEYNIIYKEIINKGKYELPEELTIVKNSRKYNI